MSLYIIFTQVKIRPPNCIESGNAFKILDNDTGVISKSISTVNATDAATTSADTCTSIASDDLIRPSNISSEDHLRVSRLESHAYAVHINRFMFNVFPASSHHGTCGEVVEAMKKSQDDVIRTFINKTKQ